MSYTAPGRTTVGFEFNYNIFGFSANPIPFELKPDTEFKKGQLVCLGHFGQGATDCGKLRPMVAADQVDEEVLIGVMAESIKQADNPADKITYGLVYCNPGNIYRVSFTNWDEIVGDSTGTKTKLELAAVTNEDNIRGTLMYIYEGPGAGNTRTIVTADNSNFITWIGDIEANTTTDTKAFLLSQSVEHAGINVGSVGADVDATSMKVDVGASLNASENPIKVVGIDARALMMDVMLHGPLHL